MLLTEIMDRVKAGYDTFYTGCARGMDIVFGTQVLLLKKTACPNIRLIGVVPHEGQANHWTETWRDALGVWNPTVGRVSNAGRDPA